MKSEQLCNKNTESGGDKPTDEGFKIGCYRKFVESNTECDGSIAN